MKNWIKSRADWFLKGTAHYLTLQIGYRYAKHFPMYFVVGFPRSGTSWLSDLVADYYNLPRPKHYYLPIACAAVLHTHHKPNRKFKNTFYIYRDGRDTYTSYFFYERKYVQANPASFYSKQFKKLWGDRIFDGAYQKENFTKYLDWVFANKMLWSDHIDIWRNASLSNQEIVMISYEELLDNTEDTMQRAIYQLDGKVDQEVLQEVIAKNAFEKQIKRPAHQHKTPLRKGKKNSWMDVFNQDSIQLFNQYCGETLIHLGYVKDMHWGEPKEMPKEVGEVIAK